MTAGRPFTETTRPRLCVCLDDSSRDAASSEFVAAGWTMASTELGAAAGSSASGVPIVWVAEVRSGDDISTVAAALVRGRSVIARPCDDLVASDLFDQCRRLATAEWFDGDARPVSDQLDQVHLALLLHIEQGSSVAAAARACHLSERTAARRLSESRRRLGARTTAEAAARLGARIRQLRPPG